MSIVVTHMAKLFITHHVLCGNTGQQWMEMAISNPETRENKGAYSIEIKINQISEGMNL